MSFKYSDLGNLLEKEELFSNPNDMRGIQVFQHLLSGNFIKFDRQKQLDYLEELKHDTQEVPEKIKTLIIERYCPLFANLNKWLEHEDIVPVFKNFIIKICKMKNRSMTIKTEVFNKFIYEFEGNKTLSLEKEENRKFFKEVFKLSIENIEAVSEKQLLYIMLTKIIFEKKEELPLEFVKEIGSIYLNNNIFTEKKFQTTKIININEWLRAQDLNEFYKTNKNLKNIITDKEVVDSICTKFIVDYSQLEKDTQTKVTWLKKNYEHSIEILTEKIEGIEDITDFFYHKKNNIMTVFMIYEKENRYVQIIKEFFKQYPATLHNVQEINTEVNEKFFFKLKIEDNLPHKNLKVKSHKI